MDLPTTPGTTFMVHVKPNASRTELVGYDARRDAFIMRVSAVPDKGKANDELLRYLKKTCGVACEIVSGHAARKKRLRVL